MAGEKILIAEDDAGIRSILKTSLRNEGYQIETASTGKEAVDLAQQENFDLLLTDIVMPTMSGLEAIRVLKESGLTMKYVAITGYNNTDILVKALTVGVDEYLVKPFTPSRLKAVISRVLNRETSVNQFEQLLRKQLIDLYYQLSEEREKHAPISYSEGQGIFWHLKTWFLRPLQIIKSRRPVKSQPPLVELSRLTDSIVHDMRNGLGIIRNTIGFLGDNLTNSDYQADLLKISHSLDFCELVLGNLSTLGEQDIFQPTQINLETIVREMYFILERKLVDVEFVLDIAPDASEILADEGQMKQIFMNLIKNAGEAMPEGGTLTVRSRREGLMIKLEISDTGCGISPENQERLFKEFFTTKDRGYGLGLHIVNTIVKRHSGSIAVESREGEGTTFILHLPIHLPIEEE